MKMRNYYIDFENVKTAGLAGLEDLASDDSVKIFAKSETDAMKFKDIKTVMKARAHIVIDDVITGTKNALDFQLLTELLIDATEGDGTQGKSRFIIVSKDRGYDPAIAQMKKRGINNVTRVESIGKDIKPKKETTPAAPRKKPASKGKPVSRQAPAKTDRKIRDIIRDKCGMEITTAQSAYVYSALLAGESKNAFYNYFRSAMGEAGGREFYNQIKKAFDDLRALPVKKP